MKKLRILQSFSKLVVINPLTTIAPNMRNFIAIFRSNPQHLQAFRRKSCKYTHRGGVTLLPPDDSATKNPVPANYSASR